jgi:hypothetical protein
VQINGLDFSNLGFQDSLLPPRNWLWLVPPEFAGHMSTSGKKWFILLLRRWLASAAAATKT